jgi:hypothetical protein
MALFAGNTGLCHANLSGLKWSWEVPIAELSRICSSFQRKRSNRGVLHVVILNDAAWSIIETQRGKHPGWVFSNRGTYPSHEQYGVAARPSGSEAAIRSGS